MKKIFNKINQVIKLSFPYTALLALIVGIVNIVLISKAQSDIEYTYNRVDDVESAIQNINNDYDNSDVLDMIKEHHNRVINEIDSEASSIKSTVRLWSN